jgi:hypothetical protein
MEGGGYAVPSGQTAPEPGTCRVGHYSSNFSESWLAVKPGTEDLVGASKFSFEKFSTFSDFHRTAVMLDVDGSTDAAEIPRFVATLCYSADFLAGLVGSAIALSRISGPEEPGVRRRYG